MIYRKTSSKSLDEIDQAIRTAAANQKFGVLGMYDLKQTMKSKGVEFDREVRVYEVCNPNHAKTVLTEAMEVSTMLPCRISVYSDGGKLEIATMLPTAMMKGFAGSETLNNTAATVETAMKAMIDEAA